MENRKYKTFYTQKDLEDKKDQVCQAAYKVLKTLKHNNIVSTTIWELEKRLEELFEEDGADTGN